MERFICIHGHFYQPPRENPWLEEIEIEDSAAPYHDWNERITAECYAPNSASRLLDGEDRIIDIVNNYEKISFNFGPTLLSWIEKHYAEHYAAILDADMRSADLRSGHGNAIAQVYNHLIMPLASPRDKRTQVRWGISDFTHRFKRRPEGMWLPETAVDMETLDIMSEEGIKFTILAPHQAAKVRKIGDRDWKDIAAGNIDPTRAYHCGLPSGRSISIFFYDGPISKAIAFERLLNKGEDFATRLLAGFSDARDWSQILHIATDGESYGHHHKFGDMALAYALHRIETTGDVRLTNYGEYLEGHPPLYEVQISGNTSWSCSHGVERWRADCGCSTGGHPGWNQQWRAPLRGALDWLRDRVSPMFEERTGKYLRDPWAARDDYISVILDRSGECVDAFLNKYAIRDLTEAERTDVLELMEMQRHALLMYTSCGWFFDELSGIETLQILQYSGRVIQLAEKLFDLGLEEPFKEKLSGAKSNIQKYRDGAAIYENFVQTAAVDFRKVASHYALSSLIREYGETEKVYSYSVKKKDYQGRQEGEVKLAVGRIEIISDIIFDSEEISFAVLHLGGHIFNCGLKTYRDEGSYQPMKKEILSAFKEGAVADIIRMMDSHFGVNIYSLKNLFRDEQRRLLDLVITKALEDFEHAYRLIYENHRTLMSFLQEAGMPIPKGFLTAAEFTLALDIKRAFSEENIDAGRIRAIMGDIRKWNLQLDVAGLEFTVRNKGKEMIDALQREPSDLSLLLNILAMVELIAGLPLEMNFWQLQNTYFKMARTCCRDLLTAAKNGDEAAVKLSEAYRRTADLLNFNTSSLFPGD